MIEDLEVRLDTFVETEGKLIVRTIYVDDASKIPFHINSTEILFARFGLALYQSPDIEQVELVLRDLDPEIAAMIQIIFPGTGSHVKLGMRPEVITGIILPNLHRVQNLTDFFLLQGPGGHPTVLDLANYEKGHWE